MQDGFKLLLEGYAEREEECKRALLKMGERRRAERERVQKEKDRLDRELAQRLEALDGEEQEEEMERQRIEVAVEAIRKLQETDSAPLVNSRRMLEL